MHTPAPASLWASKGVPKQLLRQQHSATHGQPTGAHTVQPRALKKVLPVPPASFLGPLGVAVTKQMGKKSVSQASPKMSPLD